VRAVRQLMATSLLMVATFGSPQTESATLDQACATNFLWKRRVLEYQQKLPTVAAIDCRDVVRANDVVPNRSPQAVHTALARRFVGRNIVEIGTQNGDGLMCFATFAQQSMGIEMDHTDCERAKKRLTKANLAVDMRCSDFMALPPNAFAGAEYITWYLGGLSNNLGVLKSLHQRRADFPANVEAVVLHDMCMKKETLRATSS